MSRSAMPAARNEVTQRLKPPKVTTFCSTPQRHGHIGTVADGCKRLRTQKQRRANTSQPPDPQSKTRTLGYAFGKKITIKIHPGSLAKRCPKDFWASTFSSPTLEDCGIESRPALRPLGRATVTSSIFFSFEHRLIGSRP